MRKFHSVDEIKPSCEYLRQAYERALKGAFDFVPRPGANLNWDKKFGNAVSTRGTLIGRDSCKNCDKAIEVILKLKEISAVSYYGREIKLYDTLGGTETIKISGHPCKEVCR